MLQAQGRINYWSQLAILLGLVGGGIIISAVITFFIGNSALGTTTLTGTAKMEALQQALFKPENAGYAQAVQIASTFFIMFLPALGFILICYKKMLWAGFSKHFSVQQIGVGFLIIFAANYFAAPFADITKSVLANFPSINADAKAAEDLYNKTVESMGNLKGWSQFLIAVFVIAFCPAVFEEMLFRGVAQNFLTQWTKKPTLAIVIVSLLFSLIHSSYYLFIPRFILGYVLGLMFYYTKNIWVNIIAHFINNLFALSALFYATANKKTVSVNDIDVKLPVWSVFITIAILYGLFMLLIKLSKENRNRIALKENLIFNNEPYLANQV